MKLKEMMVTVGFLALFIFAIMSFIITTQSDSNTSTRITDNTIINDTFNDLSEDLASRDAYTASDNFGEVTPTQESRLEVTNIVSPTTVAKQTIIGFWNIYIKLPQAILGVGSGVATLLTTMLLILLIVAIWAVWKGVIE